MEVKQQPSIFEMAWPTQDNHLLLSIVMTTLVLLCGNWMSLACTFIAMILSCSALYDDITGYSGLPKAKVSLLLNMVALLLMAAMWYQVLLSNEVSAGGGGGGGGRLSCSSAMFCTLRFCPFSPYGYSYRYHKPITHAACFCSYV
eukprot:Em0017g651a